jgi:hypothetical protein
MLVSSVPLSLPHSSGRPRLAMTASSSRAARAPDSDLSGTRHRLSRVKSSTTVKSFGRRLAYESPRGTNPRCVARGLWGSEELRVVRVTGVVFTRLPRTVATAVLPAKPATAPMPRVGQIGDDVWDRRD